MYGRNMDIENALDRCMSDAETELHRADKLLRKLKKTIKSYGIRVCMIYPESAAFDSRVFDSVMRMKHEYDIKLGEAKPDYEGITTDNIIVVFIAGNQDSTALNKNYTVTKEDEKNIDKIKEEITTYLNEVESIIQGIEKTWKYIIRGTNPGFLYAAQIVKCALDMLYVAVSDRVVYTDYYKNEKLNRRVCEYIEPFMNSTKDKKFGSLDFAYRFNHLVKHLVTTYYVIPYDDHDIWDAIAEEKKNKDQEEEQGED